jgi:hypothetical protein
MRERGVQLNKDGKPLTDPKEMEARMGEMSDTFIKRTLPTFIRNGVVEASVAAS